MGCLRRSNDGNSLTRYGHLEPRSEQTVQYANGDVYTASFLSLIVKHVKQQLIHNTHAVASPTPVNCCLSVLGAVVLRYVP